MLHNYLYQSNAQTLNGHLLSCDGNLKILNGWIKTLHIKSEQHPVSVIYCFLLHNSELKRELSSGLHAEECQQSLLARRETFSVAAGGSLSLSCVVQHCGKAWTGKWMWRNSTDDTSRTIKDSVNRTVKKLSDNQTQLNLNLQRVNQLDEGFYGCMVTWDQGDTEQGHFTYVNVTAGMWDHIYWPNVCQCTLAGVCRLIALLLYIFLCPLPAVPTPRSVLHRVLVCACAFLCLPIILGLARCLSSEVKPQPLPRTLSAHTAEYRDPPRPAPQPPPRCPVPQKSRAPQKRRKGILYSYYVAWNTDKTLL